MTERIELDDLATRLGETIDELGGDDTVRIITRDGADVAALITLGALKRGLDAIERAERVVTERKSADLPDSDTLIRRIDALRMQMGMAPFGPEY